MDKKAAVIAIYAKRWPDKVNSILRKFDAKMAVIELVIEDAYDASDLDHAKVLEQRLEEQWDLILDYIRAKREKDFVVPKPIDRSW